MRVVVIVQARMDSSRLPGKVLKRVKGKPLLGHMIERVRLMKSAQQIVVATTESMNDQAIVDYCQRLKVKCFRGSRQDVLSRFYEVAVEEAAQVIVRLTADCPLIDPVVIDDMVKNFILAQPYLDYMSNTLVRTFPRGFDAEVFSFEVLEEAHNKAALPLEREHVTPYIYLRWKIFRVANYFSKLGNKSDYRLTVDYAEDLDLITQVIRKLQSQEPSSLGSLKEIIEILDKNPDIAKINAHRRQKTLQE